MTMRSASDERLSQEYPQTSTNGFSQDSLKIVSLAPLEKDYVGETMSSKKEVTSSPLSSVLEKDDENILSDSAEASFSVTETTSAFLEEEGSGEELQMVKETSAAKLPEVRDDVHKMEGVFEADVGTLDVHVIEKNGSQHQKTERVRVKDNAFVGRSVNIDLVDDTALLNVVPFSKKPKDHPKVAPRKHKKNCGKQQDKGNASNVAEASGNKLRIMYTINQMKSMRYANMASQRKLWSDVYARMLPELVAEYEGLVSLKNQKTAKSNMRESGIGPVSALPRRNRVNIFVH